ncbi:hypothetical protein FQN51_002552 [Onygenales sp. PD_10]|nr:hypothetical protein FQN51_002552 [Onygenales sp. PD_10]
MSSQHQKRILQEQKEENMVLRELLAAHGIQFEAELERRKALRTGNHHAHANSFSGSNSHSHSHSHSQSHGLLGSGNFLTTPPTTVSALSPGTASDYTDNGNMYSYSGSHGHQLEQPGVLAESNQLGNDSTAIGDMPGVFETDPQLGIDFILKLEDSCRSHLEYVCKRAEDDVENETISGHALMASCPPPTQMAAADPGQIYPIQTNDPPHANLAMLLNLSRQLVTEGQITPVMALQYLKSHDMYPSLTREDVRHMMDDLNGKIRCYGFGAVMEDFEFMDSFSSVLGSKMDSIMDLGDDMKALPPTPSQRMDDLMYS